VALAPILWAALHVVKSASSTPGGALSDRIGRRPTLIMGGCCTPRCTLGFACARRLAGVGAVRRLRRLLRLTEGSERALIADLVALERRGTAFGWYNLAIGLGALPASLLFGYVWDHAGRATAFIDGRVARARRGDRDSSRDERSAAAAAGPVVAPRERVARELVARQRRRIRDGGARRAPEPAVVRARRYAPNDGRAPICSQREEWRERSVTTQSPAPEQRSLNGTSVLRRNLAPPITATHSRMAVREDDEHGEQEEAATAASSSRWRSSGESRPHSSRPGGSVPAACGGLNTRACARKSRARLRERASPNLRSS
jgi:hypothetical protein